MNRKQEILVNYREITITLERLDLEIERLSRTGFIGGPRELRSPQITGLPRGTNDPEAAILQRADTDEVLEKIEMKCAELREMVDAFEIIMDGIVDRRLRIIVRNYYALGWTDERIAEQLELSRQHVNRLRSAYIEGLN